jgi:transcriptional regulator with XRE-family HTH domain
MNADVPSIERIYMAKSFDSLIRRTTTNRTRRRAAKRTQELLGELLVIELHQLAGKSQREIAATLGIKQPSIAKLEKQSDMQISTLEKIVQALGANWKCLPAFPKVRSRSDDSEGIGEGRSLPTLEKCNCSDRRVFQRNRQRHRVGISTLHRRLGQLSGRRNRKRRLITCDALQTGDRQAKPLVAVANLDTITAEPEPQQRN